MWDREIEEILAEVHTMAHVRPAVQRLVGRAKQASGRDNITAVLALVEDVSARAVTRRTAGPKWLTKVRQLIQRTPAAPQPPPVPQQPGKPADGIRP